MLCVCVANPSIELLLCCRGHEQACLSCASDYMVILRLSSGGGQRPASCKLSVHHFKQAGPGTEPTPHGPSASAPHWLPVGGSFTAHQRSTSQGTHNNHDSDFRGPAVTVEHRLRYVHDIADVTVSSLKAPAMPRPETTRTGSSLSKAWEGVNRRKSGPGASCLTGCRLPVYISENAWWRFQEPNVAAAEANDLPPSTNDSAT